MAPEQVPFRTRTAFVRFLAEAGLSDFIVIDKRTAEAVLTERRLELLEFLRDRDVDSVTGLAEALGRDKAAVSRDLDLLWEESLVDFEQAGQRKVPRLAHRTVVIEPIL